MGVARELLYMGVLALIAFVSVGFVLSLMIGAHDLFLRLRSNRRR